jgi:hypothetical protein
MSRTSLITRRVAAAYSPAPVAPLLPAIDFNDRLSSLYALAQRSHYIFASPLGPFYKGARHYHLPRFVYFGPHSSDDSLRLAFYAGFDSSDLRGTLALLHFVEWLALQPEHAQGLNLSFFPLIDVGGLLQHREGGLSTASWLDSIEPELDLLSKDARGRGYYGFIRVETSRTADEVVTIRLRGNTGDDIGAERLSSADVQPWEVRWEAESAETVVTEGPLSLADDLSFQPFELTLLLPANWPDAMHREAVTSILKRFLQRYRGFHAYGQHL